MAVPVDYRIPPVQPANVVYWQRSLASLQSLASATVHYIGWRARRLTTSIVTWGDADYITASSGVTATHHVRLRTSPICAHIFAAFTYQAHDSESGGCQIEAALYTVAGVLVDGPAVWDSTVGTLPTQTIVHGVGLIGVPEAPHLTTHTGVAESPPLVERPRLLVVDATNRNADLDLQVTTVNCRLRSVTAWELPTAEI